MLNKLRTWLSAKMPSQAALRENKLLKIFGERFLEPDYWNYNRRSSAIAIAAGLFASWFPLPFHSLLAIGSALLLRGYLPLAIAMVWVSNPLTIAPMMVGAYRLGNHMLGLPMRNFKHLFVHDFWAIAPPLLTGAFTLALSSALLGWLLTRIFWRCSIIRSWQKRRR